MSPGVGPLEPKPWCSFKSGKAQIALRGKPQPGSCWVLADLCSWVCCQCGNPTWLSMCPLVLNKQESDSHKTLGSGQQKPTPTTTDPSKHKPPRCLGGWLPFGSPPNKHYLPKRMHTLVDVLVKKKHNKKRESCQHNDTKTA